MASVIASAFTETTVHTWYTTLARPEWTPPSTVFGPAWTILYIAITFAAYRVWKATGWTTGRKALILFFVQLALNAAWPGFFFALKNPALGLVEIVILWCTVLATTMAFAKIDRLAGAIFVVYLSWITFATALNAAFWSLNR